MTDERRAVEIRDIINTYRAAARIDMVTGRFTEGLPEQFDELSRLVREKDAKRKERLRLQDDESGRVPLSIQVGQ